MTINTQKLRDLVTFDFELPVSVRDAVDDACDHIDAQAAKIARLRDALERIISLDGQEDNEWDAVERLIPEMMSIARAALLGENNAEG